MKPLRHASMPPNWTRSMASLRANEQLHMHMMWVKYILSLNLDAYILGSSLNIMCLDQWATLQERSLPIPIAALLSQGGSSVWLDWIPYIGCKVCRVFSVLHLSCLAGYQAKIGLNSSRSVGLNFPIQGLEVLIQSGHKTSTPQMLQVFTDSSRWFMIHTLISPLNTYGIWMRSFN